MLDLLNTQQKIYVRVNKIITSDSQKASLIIFFGGEKKINCRKPCELSQSKQGSNDNKSLTNQNAVFEARKSKRRRQGDLSLPKCTENKYLF
jgi:hypothetical protein